MRNNLESKAEAMSEQEKFEKWARPDSIQIHKDENGDYTERGMQAAFNGWLARSKIVEDQTVAPWRDHPAAIDSKALATAQEIALMWGQDRSHFVSRIQVAVTEAMLWLRDATQRS